MAYSTVADVQKLFANITFDGTTPVTDADITNVHIPNADAYIDARLRRFYETPITASGDLGLLRLISMNLAAGFVAEVLYETSSQPNDQASARRHRETAERLLDGVLRGDLTLETARRPIADAGVLADYEPLSDEERRIEPLVRLIEDH